MVQRRGFPATGATVFVAGGSGAVTGLLVRLFVPTAAGLTAAARTMLHIQLLPGISQATASETCLAQLMPSAVAWSPLAGPLFGALAGVVFVYGSKVGWCTRQAFL